MQKTAQWGDRDVEEVIGTLLRVGLVAAAGIVVAGGLCYLVRHGLARPDYRVFRGEPSDLRSLSGILHFTLALRCRGIIQLGLLVLIATPVARVAFAVFAFAKERDRAYVVISLIVLVILAYGLAGGPSAGLR
jgi:uncharacterized membrane protein